MIYKDINKLSNVMSRNKAIYTTSGGFDPLHIGHVRCILETAYRADVGTVVVIVNADSFLMRKKGFVFMPLCERMEIIDSLKGVDYVTSWETTDDQTCVGALNILRPNYFTKGGDRINKTSIPEWDVCKKIGCDIITGIGVGGKVQSSSSLVKKVKNA